MINRPTLSGYIAAKYWPSTVPYENPQYISFSCPIFSVICSISVATSPVPMNRPMPHSSAVPFRSSFPLPPRDCRHRWPSTAARLSLDAIVVLSKTSSSGSSSFQMLYCDSESKHWAGVDAPVPRGSNPRISNCGPTTFEMSAPRRATRSVPDPPGPPGLMRIVPRWFSFSEAGIIRSAIGVFGPTVTFE